MDGPLGRQIGLKSFKAFGIFLVKLSAPILVLCVPCPCFSLFLQKLKHLYPHPNHYLGLEFEFAFAFGPQRIRILAIMCPLSVTEMKPEILANQHHIKLMRPLYDLLMTCY